MRTLTAILHGGELDEGGFWATCIEVPGANGQGETKEECLGNLAEAVQLVLEEGQDQGACDNFHPLMNMNKSVKSIQSGEQLVDQDKPPKILPRRTQPQLKFVARSSEEAITDRMPSEPIAFCYFENSPAYRDSRK